MEDKEVGESWRRLMVKDHTYGVCRNPEFCLRCEAQRLIRKLVEERKRWIRDFDATYETEEEAERHALRDFNIPLETWK